MANMVEGPDGNLDEVANLKGIEDAQEERNVQN